MFIDIDFETRSAANLKRVGAHKYSCDPTFDILCVAFHVGDEDPFSGVDVSDSARGLAFDGDRSVWKKLKDLAKDPSVSFRAHNSAFEYTIWHNYLVPKFKFPVVVPSRWACSAALAAYKSLPRALGELTQALELPQVKDQFGKGIMMKMCSPVPEKHRAKFGMWYEDEDRFNALISYCRDDVAAEIAVWNRLGALPEAEQKVFMLDQIINRRGILIDLDQVKGAVPMKEKIKSALAKEFRTLVGFNPSQVQPLQDFIEARGFDLPKILDKKTRKMKRSLRTDGIKKMLLRPDVKQDTTLHRALEIRMEYATTSLAKYDAALAYEVDGVIRDQFMYHGASTGRWTGKAVQFQNLPRPKFDEDFDPEGDMALACDIIRNSSYDRAISRFGCEMSPMTLMKSALRGMVVPRPGFKLLVVDYSQIEARMLAWLAGQEDVLQAFRDGKDLYKFTASQIYQKPYEEITKTERFTGKTASLAFGYGGAAGAYASMAANLGVHVEEDLAAEIKDDWRARNPRIVKLWKSLNNAAILSVTTGKPQRVRGNITFRVEGEFLTIELPSTRKLWYYQPSVRDVVKDGKDGPWHSQSLTYMGSDQQRGIRWGRISTYGGKLAENVTQAASRCVLANGLLKAHAAGFDIVLHVHDEIVCEEPIDGRPVGDLEKILTEIPSWAEGLPLEADGFEAPRYRK